MKLQRARISNFRGIRDLEIDFGSPPRRITALIGENGSGKTTALQAIALTLSLATGKIQDTSQFAWHGFSMDRLSTLGPTRVEVEVVLDDQEKMGAKDGGRFSSDYPSTFRIVYERGRAQFDLRFPQLALRGSIGSVFWFDQYRSLGSAKTESAGDDWQTGVNHLRESLVTWWATHTSPNGDSRDYLAQLEERMALVFPGTKFRGVGMKGQARGIQDSYFFLERAGQTFDLAEMSSGEQAVFALMYEFVRLDIRNSVVLIDELELHLHPPQQQALLGALRNIGPDCQFIITTHSPYLKDVIPAEHEVRLEETVPCP
jgi:predicted ATPase